MASSYIKLTLLLWKNLKIRIRNKKKVFFEIFGPLLVIYLLIITIIKNLSIREIVYDRGPDSENIVADSNFHISPNKSWLTKFVSKALQTEESRIITHHNGTALRNFLDGNEKIREHTEAIEFDENLPVGSLLFITTIFQRIKNNVFSL